MIFARINVLAGQLVGAFALFDFVVAPPGAAEAQTKKVRVAVPGYTIAVLSFLAAKMNGYYAAEGLDVELIAMRAPTANLAVVERQCRVFRRSARRSYDGAARRTVEIDLLPVRQAAARALRASRNFPTSRRCAEKGSRFRVSAPSTIFCCAKRSAPTASIPTRDVTILAMGAADTRFSALVSGAIEASVLIAPVSFYAKDQGFRELAAFQDLGFVLPSGGIVARDETLKTDPLTTERFVRATIMGFLYMRDNRPGTSR